METKWINSIKWRPFFSCFVFAYGSLKKLAKYDLFAAFAHDVQLLMDFWVYLLEYMVGNTKDAFHQSGWFSPCFDAK